MGPFGKTGLRGTGEISEELELQFDSLQPEPFCRHIRVRHTLTDHEINIAEC